MRVEIRIVTHCWAGKYEQYSLALRWHLSSIWKWGVSKGYSILPCVVYNWEDKSTKRVITWFRRKLGLPIYDILLPLDQLGRRAIGRNIAAKQNDGDIVWFCDCDMFFFGEDVFAEIENLISYFQSGYTLIWPRVVHIAKDHYIGESLLKKSLGFNYVLLEEEDREKFVCKTYDRAIGGVQIVSGNFAREWGYLDGTKWVSKGLENPFSDFKDDVAYRKFCLSKGKGKAVDIEGVYRLRHLCKTYG